MGSKIITLSSDVIPKIAAGEVVERPASVVKELVENAIDAHATNIIVEIENAGLTKIRVLDDGDGMSQEDLVKSFLPHTTSKIAHADDLALIRTMGFRGEALSSICAVANVNIKSCEHGQHSGYEINVTNSHAAEPKVVGMQHGTIVEVVNLFSYVPARKKFLKSQTNEFQIISNVLTAFALAHTSIGFELYRDGKRTLKVLSKDDLLTRIQKVLGNKFSSTLLPVELETNYLKLHGYITKPFASEQNRNSQYLFVNKRIVDDLKISKAVKDGYKTLLDMRSYPPFILNIDLDWGLVDVNVHPQKERVKFWDENEVVTTVKTAIEQALEQLDLTKGASYELDKKAAEHMYLKLKDVTPIWNVRADYLPENFDQAFQIAQTYIAYPYKNDLILVDQHAAHESILYKQLLASYEQNKLSSKKQQLVHPQFIEISANRLPVVEDNLDFFAQFGFDIDIFGNDQIKISAIPEIYQGHDLKKLLMEMINDLAEDKTPSDIDEKSRQTIAFLACRSAIKAGDVLSQEEIERLLKKLAENPDLYTCPHGRPLRIVISNGDLAKMFKRS